jgi:ankyrin repeat protein
VIKKVQGILLTRVLIAFLFQGVPAHGQLPDFLSLRDTSYFKPGLDDWNLVESVIRGEPACTLLLLGRGADPDAGAGGGKTALMFASEAGDTILVKILVLNGADTELQGTDNTTPLQAAVLNGQFDAAHVLLRLGANPDHVDKYGGTPLIYAAALNEYRIADLLLFFGASDTLKDRAENDPLMTAAYFGNLETSDVLLQNGLRPDSRDREGNTPLMIAAQQGNNEMVSLLLEYGAGLELVNHQNLTPLAHAINSGAEETVRILVDSGANVNHRVNRKQNLMDLASSGSSTGIVKILKQKGASPTPRPDFSAAGVGWGNSFNRKGYMMQFRARLLDRKFGFFTETGLDISPVTHSVQVTVNDTLIHQYRERRSGWSHGIGKNFTLYSTASGMSFGCYAALHGLLSFPRYRGIQDKPPAEYNLIPAAGLFISSSFAGMKTGIERYHFGTLHEGAWKMNITFYLNIRPSENPYEKKEITY